MKSNTSKLLTLLICFSFILSSSCDDSEDPSITLTGHVIGNEGTGAAPAALANVKVKINFYTGANGLYIPVASQETTTDQKGNYTGTVKMEDAYDAYAIEIDEEYYKGCTGITSPMAIVTFKPLDQTSNTDTTTVCATGNIKVIANKANPSTADYISVKNSATNPGWTVHDSPWVTNSQDIKVFYYFPSVTNVKFTIEKKVNEVTVDEVVQELTPVAKTTKEITVQF